VNTYYNEFNVVPNYSGFGGLTKLPHRCCHFILITIHNIFVNKNNANIPTKILFFLLDYTPLFFGLYFNFFNVIVAGRKPYKKKQRYTIITTLLLLFIIIVVVYFFSLLLAKKNTSGTVYNKMHYYLCDVASYTSI